MQSTNAQGWLKAASALVIGFGILTVLASHPATSGIISFFADLLFWPVDGGQSIATAEARLLSAIGGGVMVGWGIMLWLISTRLYPRDPLLARTIIVWSIGSWFIVDSAGSIIAGAPLNALMNMTFLLMFLLPLRHSAKAATI